MPADSETTRTRTRHSYGLRLLVVLCSGVLFVIAGFLLLDITADVAWARAGGGGGYGGGGGGSSSSGGGSGGGGDLIVLLLWLCVKHPVIGIPLAIVVGVMAFYGSIEAKNQHAGRVIRRGLSAQEQQRKEEGLLRLKASDPEFNVDQFRQRVADAFVKIQHAWSEQILTTVRPFISDGIHERFDLQIDMQNAEGLRNKMENVRVKATEIVAVASANQFDTIHLRIDAEAVDYNVSLETGRKLHGTSAPQHFVEYWSFQRRQGVKTFNRPGVIEGRCPKCSAPLDIVDRADCQACGAHVNSGQYDWVLSEITQAVAWRNPHHQLDMPGIADLSQRDPAFSLQHIEDRVSVVFWRLRAAEFHGDVGVMAPVASPEYQQVFEKQLHELRARKEFWKTPAVGAVEVIDCIDEDDGRDKLRVKVKWSGIYSRKQKNNRVRTLRQKSIYTQVFVLARNKGIASHADEAFSAASCTNCGAPIGISKEGACSFCGTILTDGTRDWVLDDIRPFTSDMAFRNRASFAIRNDDDGIDIGGTQANDEDSEIALGALVRVMMIDGDLADREREALKKIGIKRGLNEGDIEAVINSGDAQSATLPMPETSREIQQHLSQLTHAVMSDGHVSSQERRLLSNYAERVNLSNADIKIALAKERRRMYREAKSALKTKSSRASTQPL